MDSLTIILLIVIAVMAVVMLVCMLGILARLKSRESGKETEIIASLIVEKILTELKTQRAEALADSREQRTELNDILGRSNLQTAQLIQSSSEATQKSLSEMQNAVRDKVDERLDAIQKSNEQKLDEMRKTVDEKLDSTLNARLKNSFEIVSQQLESVNTRLGEMRSVADSVSNLNKVLSGSKTRGILGELQLSQIIEDMMPPQLFEREVQIHESRRDRVEYAIKYPGHDDDSFVYLPIDSKFPLDDYYRLVDGYEQGDNSVIDESRKALLARIKVFAKEVREKYVSPPRTTDFAIVFLPTEGLYAEAVRDATFFEELRRSGIVLAGPTTLSAMLSSFMVGFKTLQIQKGAAEIQVTLEKTKTEFNKFSDVLVKAQTHIRQTGDDLEQLIGTRTRKINAALRNVQMVTHQERDMAVPELESYESEESWEEEQEEE